MTTQGNNESSAIGSTMGASMQVHNKHEMASTAAAAKHQAMVQARYVMALQRPRNRDQARQDLLAECGTPSFAEVAWYRRPVGKEQDPNTKEWVQKYAEGHSIRFAEAAARAWTNIAVESLTTFDSPESRVVNVSVTDLESNLSYSEDIPIEKTVERKRLGQGQKAIGMRENTYGEMVFIVAATDSQIKVKEKAEVSKTMRELVLRVLPGDIKADCAARIRETKEAKIKADPAGARKAMIDAFHGIGVSVVELEAYLGHELGICSPGEIQTMRDFYVAISDDQMTWADLRRAKDEDRKSAEPNGDGEVPKSQVDAMKAKAAKVAEEKKKKKAASEAVDATPPAEGAQGAATAPADGAPAQQATDGAAGTEGAK